MKFSRKFRNIVEIYILIPTEMSHVLKIMVFGKLYLFFIFVTFQNCLVKKKKISQSSSLIFSVLIISFNCSKS